MKSRSNDNINADQSKSGSAKKRRYNSVVRQAQSNKTREQIIKGGVELVQEFTEWDWKNLTFRAVGERAGVSERTVYRYFPTEQALKDAVIQRLVEESGVDLDSLSLSEFNSTVKGLFQYMQSFAAKSKPVADPSFSSLDKIRREALLRSVAESTPEWTPAQQEIVTATLDILWQPETYERLMNAWNFDSDQSMATLSWLIELVEHAIAHDQRPESPEQPK
ncbi:TetR/AcrR family transcriptional regulator [Ketobacter sp.]|uniref:TetR/AcrR family transcriptional regulator n=1 Tax=Ketobacter sp. TaxID=2083498 RepID=UPI000F12326F|nr:TetR/AcrR family transcriptional regulator [Ketobacter sp.]RLT95689.1 MAG: TetR/AcrR family transcriptional regulator [Ketobacter sp.]